MYFRHFCVLKDDNFSTNMFVMMPDDFRRHSPENVTSSCDPLETLSAGFEVPTSYFGNLKWYIVKLVQILVCVNIFRRILSVRTQLAAPHRRLMPIARARVARFTRAIPRSASAASHD